MRLNVIACGMLVAISLTSAGVFAGPGEDKAAADALFKAGRALVKQGKFDEACPKLEASHKLDPATGTLLALGDCYELNGQTASAWTTFNDARAMARKANDTKRSEEAERRAGLLEPKLSKLMIEVPQDTRVSGVEVRRNGKLIEPAMYGLAVAIDPGKQTIDATAPGQQVWSTEIIVESKPAVTTVRIPSLVDMKPAVVEYAVPKSPPPMYTTPKPPPNETESSGFGTQKTIGVVVAGVGVVGIAVGSYFGVGAISLVDEANRYCDGDDPPRCRSYAGVQAHQAANTAANIANVSIGVGAAAIITGIVLIAVAPKSAPKTSSTWQIAPVVVPGSASISVTGAF